MLLYCCFVAVVVVDLRLLLLLFFYFDAVVVVVVVIVFVIFVLLFCFCCFVFDVSFWLFCYDIPPWPSYLTKTTFPLIQTLTRAVLQFLRCFFSISCLPEWSSQWRTSAKKWIRFIWGWMNIYIFSDWTNLSGVTYEASIKK